MRTYKYLILLFIVLTSVILPTKSIFAAGPNYATSKEHFQLYYVGYIQMQSSYYDHEYGGHVFNGYMRYTNGESIDSGRIYVGPGRGPNDGTVYKRSYTQVDTFNPVAPRTKFHWNFNVAPTNAWPTRSVATKDENAWNIENTFPVSGTIEH